MKHWKITWVNSGTGMHSKVIREDLFNIVYNLAAHGIMIYEVIKIEMVEEPVVLAPTNMGGFPGSTGAPFPNANPTTC